MKVDENDLVSLLSSVDLDGSGSLDYTEFLAATLNARTYMQEDALWSAFRVFDVDGNGKLSKEEVSRVFSGGGNKYGLGSSLFRFESGDLDALIAEIGTDGDGLISFEEFKEMMISQDDQTGAQEVRDGIKDIRAHFGEESGPSPRATHGVRSDLGRSLDPWGAGVHFAEEPGDAQLSP